MTREYIQGDWVKSNGDFKSLKAEVCEVRETNYLLLCKESGHFFRVKKGEVEPIPLTSEILKKNGWQLRKAWGEYWFIQDEDNFNPKKHELDVIALNYLAGEWDVCIEDTLINHTKIKYVHQLQHLLFGLGMESNMEV